MIIVMSPSATKEDIDKVESKLKSVGLQAHLSVGAERTIVGVIGDKKIIGNLEMNMLPGVEKTVRITEKYKLVSREFHPENTVVDVDGVKVGGEQLVVMAGPCSVESLEQLREAAKAVKEGGAQFLRGGAFKPRTSPYDFQGLAEDGLKYRAGGAVRRPLSGRCPQYAELPALESPGQGQEACHAEAGALCHHQRVAQRCRVHRRRGQ